MATPLGLGSGGFSRLGTGQNKGDENAEQVVRAALDLGINLIDTAEAYGTETAIGNVIRGVKRDSVILSTKLSYRLRAENRLKTPVEIEASLEASLGRLHTDYVDIYHIHGVDARDYPAVIETTLPVVQRMREKGKLRFIGITEVFGTDTDHRTLNLAVLDDYWDVMMVGFNLLNTSARELIFKATQVRNVGVLGMFAVRQALISYDNLETYLRRQVHEGHVSPEVLRSLLMVRELLDSGTCGSLTEAAYRYCASEPAIDCVLSGTGSVEHLRQNVDDIQKPPLPAEFVAGIEPVFAEVAALSGQLGMQ